MSCVEVQDSEWARLINHHFTAWNFFFLKSSFHGMKNFFFNTLRCSHIKITLIVLSVDVLRWGNNHINRGRGRQRGFQWEMDVRMVMGGANGALVGKEVGQVLRGQHQVVLGRVLHKTRVSVVWVWTVQAAITRLPLDALGKVVMIPFGVCDVWMMLRVRGVVGSESFIQMRYPPIEVGMFLTG